MKTILFSMLFFSVEPIAADIQSTKHIGSKMLFQRGTNNFIYGKAGAKESLTIAFHGEKYRTLANSRDDSRGNPFGYPIKLSQDHDFGNYRRPEASRLYKFWTTARFAPYGICLQFGMELIYCGVTLAVTQSHCAK
jgi:hypothetical protein